MNLNDVPLSGQSLNVSRPLIQGNFSNIDTTFSVNHVGFIGTASGAGKHTFLQMPEQAAAPTTAVNEVGVYSKVGTTSSQSELFFRRENNGSEVPMTEHGLNPALPGIPQWGWTMLPSGLMMNFGWGTTSNAVPTFFMKAFSTACVSITATLATTGEGHTIEIPYGFTTKTSFKARAYDLNGHEQNKWFYYIAIGV